VTAARAPHLALAPLPRRALSVAVAVLVMMLGACAGAPGGSSESAGAAGREDGSVDSATVARLEREARALVRTDGCDSASGCATAPLGERPCGGPREYLVYCRASTDSAALFTKLDELGRAERAWNERRGAVSTCEMRMPPTTELVGQRCRAAAR